MGENETSHNKQDGDGEVNNTQQTRKTKQNKTKKFLLDFLL